MAKSTFMNLPKISDNQYWHNQANLGEAPDWITKEKCTDWFKTTDQLLENTIFGYPEKEFMQRQYK